MSQKEYFKLHNHVLKPKIKDSKLVPDMKVSFQNDRKFICPLCNSVFPFSKMKNGYDSAVYHQCPKCKLKFEFNGNDACMWKDNS